MTIQAQQPDPGQRPEAQPDDSRHPEPLGLDDVTDAERADAGAPATDGGLGFDDVTEAELDTLMGSEPEEGGLGLDDLLIIPHDEDERAA